MTTFGRSLAAIWFLGLILRLAYAIHQRDWAVIGDAQTFHLEGGFLVHGEGFRRAFEDVPTTEHPPVHVVLIAGLDLIGIGSTAGQKAAFAVLGSATPVLLGLLARRVARLAGIVRPARVGLLAAALGAAYPMLWVADGSLMSETTYGVLVAAALLAATGALERSTPVRWVALGALLGLAALTRGEAIGLVVLLALPLAYRARSWRAAAATVAATVLVLAPWTLRNLRTFSEPVLISTNSYGIWAGANCRPTYYGALIGSWVFSCYGAVPRGDEVRQNLVYRRRGLTYAGAHAGRIPVVVAARLGRLLDVYEPWTQGVFLASAEGRRPAAQKLALLGWWALAPLALGGALVLRRREAHGVLIVLLAPVLLVVLVAATTYGSTRFRFAAEPSIVVLAAVALDALLARRMARA